VADGTSEGSGPDVVVTNYEAAHRYEAHIDGQLAGLTTYLVRDDRVILTHAEVCPRWGQRGVATTMVRTAVDDIIAHGKMITPQCPFVIGFVRRHPEYLEHVDPPHRAQFESEDDGGTGRQGV
jgi:uncharacterized protein